MIRNQEYLSLLVADQDNNSSSIKAKRTIWRWWNQLSRLQRSLFYISIISCGILILYVLPNLIKEAIVQESITNNNVEITKQPITAKLILNKIENNQQQINVHNILDRNFPKIYENKKHVVIFSGSQNKRQEAVVEAFRHAWNGYRTHAWGYDHLKPVSGGRANWFGVGLTIVDSLDTLYIMGLNKEYDEAREWVDKKLSFDISTDVNLFEITIRVLGGLLSIYHLTNDKLYLNKAHNLGERLLPCFNTDSGIPYSDINLMTGIAHAPKWSPDSSTSEVTTIQLEFRDLSRCTNDWRFEQVASRVSEIVHKLPKIDGLVPIFINANTGKFRPYSTITMGARGDSYYEYLLKQWIQTGKKIDHFRDDYLAAIQGAKNILMKRTATNILFIGELLGTTENFKPKMDHLTCYLPGTLALGVHNGLPQEHLSLAEDLLNTCYQMYTRQPTCLAPEITYFNIREETASPDMYVKTADAHNLLRPEFIESLWYMSVLVPENRSRYQDWGWKVFEAFEKYTKVRYGYTSIANVRNEKQTRPLDKMESFFLAETLKYLYLLFSNNSKAEISLDEYVINSEAHLIPIKP